MMMLSLPILNELTPLNFETHYLMDLFIQNRVGMVPCYIVLEEATVKDCQSILKKNFSNINLFRYKS